MLGFQVMLPKFKEWANKWTRLGFDMRTNQHIFTLDTYCLFRRIMQAIINWFLSGECRHVQVQFSYACIAGVTDDMYV